MGTMMWNLQSRFLVAIQNNDVSAAKELLEHGLDPDIRFHLGSQVRPAVCLCVERGHIQLLQVLLQWGCSVNQSDSCGLSALHIAASHSYENMVGLLLKGRAQVNAVTLQGHTPLHLASQRHSVEVVRMLVEAGAEIDRYDDERKTPLLNACIQGHAAVADFLLKHHADVNIRSPCGNTPLLFAASAPLLDITFLSRLLKAKANVSCQNRQGEAPLHAILRGGHKPNRLDAIDLFLSHNCDANAKTNLGHSPLHLAVLEHDSDAVLRLVKAGCTVDCKDELGLTPLFYVVRDGNYPLAALLFAAGARIPHRDWLSDPDVLAEMKDPSLLDWLATEGRKCPRLTQMCRMSFRTYYGGEAQNLIGNLEIPASLKRYLSFETL